MAIITSAFKEYDGWNACISPGIWFWFQNLGWFGNPREATAVKQKPNSAELGFSTVDALTGMTILSACLALSLSAQASARRVADLARETRAASTLLQLASDRDPGTVQSASGVSGPLVWQVSRGFAESTNSVPLCLVRAEVRRPGTQRIWRRDVLQRCSPKS